MAVCFCLTSGVPVLLRGGAPAGGGGSGGGGTGEPPAPARRVPGPALLTGGENKARPAPQPRVFPTTTTGRASTPGAAFPPPTTITPAGPPAGNSGRPLTR